MSKLKVLLPIAIFGAYLYFLSGNIPGVPALGDFFHPSTGFWQTAKLAQSEPVNSTETLVLTDTVTITWDSLRIPHIKASNEQDLYQAQGYITARDRMWQMELQTHFAAGRVSEIVGKRALPLDRKNRRIGLAWAAKKANKDLKENYPDVYAHLEAYTAGVNQYINETPVSQLPIEYKLLNYQPEQWTAEKCVLLIKYMANDLCGYDDDNTLTAYHNALGDSLYFSLFPDQFPEDTVAIIPFPNVADGTNYSNSTAGLLPTKTEAIAYQETKIPFDQPIDPDNGSNNWAVGPSKTDGKSTLLSNDPHLGLNLPSLWYTVQLTTPEMNYYGVSLPGLPFVVIGHNEDIAWALTNAGRDVRDWYSITSDNGKTYNGPQGQMAFRLQEEIFRTKEGEVIIDTVKYTHLGPVVYDEVFPGDSSRINQAMFWTAHESETELVAVSQLVNAKNYQEFRSAVANFNAPGQNFLYADRNGNIGLNQQGSFMDRTDGSGRFITPMEEAKDYSFIPKQDNPEGYNPEMGFLSSANQHPLRAESSYSSHGNFEHYRNRRIHDVLTKGSNMDVQDMIDLQNDNYTLLAAEILPMVLPLLPASNMTEELKAWDYYSNADSKAASLFAAFWKEMQANTWDELSAIQAELQYPEEIITSRIIQNDPNSRWFDIRSTPEKEFMQDIVKMSWAKVISDYPSLEEVPVYGRYKQTIITHLSRSLTPFSREVFVGGGRLIVNATKEGHGPSWRMVVKMNQDTLQAYGIYPGGQSGNPASPYYDNFLPIWEKGELLPQQFIQNK